jgi:hypothetical protein
MFRSEAPWVGFALLDNTRAAGREDAMDCIVGVTRECTTYLVQNMQQQQQQQQQKQG